MTDHVPQIIRVPASEIAGAGFVERRLRPPDEVERLRALLDSQMVAAGPYMLTQWTDDIRHADPCDCDLDEETAGERCMENSEWTYAVVVDGGAFAPRLIVKLPKRPPDQCQGDEDHAVPLTTRPCCEGEMTTVRHWLVMRDDHEGNMFSISDRDAGPITAEERARHWLRPGYHIEVQDQTWWSGPTTWTTVRCDKDAP